MSGASIRPEVRVKVGDREILLAMPLGGLERVAEVNPRLSELTLALELGVNDWKEAKAVLQAGLEFGGSGLDVEALYQAHYLEGCRTIAWRLMQAATNGVDPGEATAAATETGGSA